MVGAESGLAILAALSLAPLAAEGSARFAVLAAMLALLTGSWNGRRTVAWTNVRDADLELLASFGSFFAVKLVGELRGHEARLGRSSFAAYVLAEHWRGARRQCSPT